MNENASRHCDGVQEILSACESALSFLRVQVANIDGSLAHQPDAPSTSVAAPEPQNSIFFQSKSFYEFASLNIKIRKYRYAAYEAFFTSLQALTQRRFPNVRMYVHGSFQQGTAITGSDLDISFDCLNGATYDLGNILVFVKENYRALNLNGTVEYIAARVPVIRLRADGDLFIDISSPGPRHLSRQAGSFIKVLMDARKDLNLYVCILKQAFSQSRVYGGRRLALGGIGITVLVAWVMQQMNLLPFFDRFDAVAEELRPGSPSWKAYWNAHRVQSSDDEAISDNAVRQRFAEILRRLIATDLYYVFSLCGQYPRTILENGLVIFTPPNNAQNAANVVSKQTRLNDLVPLMKHFLTEWIKDPYAFLIKIS
uniref:Poly(A) RNA polymerase mitochondrial-like central palm domain-containing protein n=1 Tax=Panagrolaimus superbus TaxID=310955 RepID=A0A914Z2R3_9BILA